VGAPDPSRSTETPTEADREHVRAALGREPRGNWRVAARDAAGHPSVIENPPILPDGTPMPTRYWLVDPDLVRRIGTLEAEGGVARAEAEIGLEELARVHEQFGSERDAAVPERHAGPRPTGGVGGTRVGVKCLHAHVANLLAGGDDPVGRWAMGHL